MELEEKPCDEASCTLVSDSTVSFYDWCCCHGYLPAVQHTSCLLFDQGDCITFLLSLLLLDDAITCYGFLRFFPVMFPVVMCTLPSIEPLCYLDFYAPVPI